MTDVREGVLGRLERDIAVLVGRTAERAPGRLAVLLLDCREGEAGLVALIRLGAVEGDLPRRRVRIGEVQAIGSGTVGRRRHGQRAVAVIGDIDRHRVGRAVVGDAVDCVTTVILAHGVGIGVARIAQCVVDRREGDVALLVGRAVDLTPGCLSVLLLDRRVGEEPGGRLDIKFLQCLDAREIELALSGVDIGEVEVLGVVVIRLFDLQRTVTVVGDLHREGIGLPAGLHACGVVRDLGHRVGVLAHVGQRVLDGRIVDGRAAVSRRVVITVSLGDRLGCLVDGEAVDVGDREVAAFHGLGAREFELARRGVGVGEGKVANRISPRRMQMSLVVIRHAHVDAVRLRLSRDTALRGLNLGHGVIVFANLVVGDIGEDDRAIGSVRTRGDDLGLTVDRLRHLEVELARLLIAPRQPLVAGKADGGRVVPIGIGELDGIGLVSHDLCREIALAVIGHRDLHGLDRLVVSQATRIARLLADLIRVGLAGIGLGVVDSVEAEAHLRAARRADSDGRGVGRLVGAIRHRRAILACEGKGVAVTLNELAARDFLDAADRELVGGRVLVGKGQVARIIRTCRRQRAVKVVNDMHVDAVRLRLGCDTTLRGRNLGHGVVVVARRRIVDRREGNRAVRVIGTRGDDLGLAVDRLRHLEGKLAGGHSAAGQGLGALEHDGTGRGVGVGEVEMLRVIARVCDIDVALTVVSNGHFDGMGHARLRHTGNVGLVLSHVIGVRLGCSVGDSVLIQ